MTVAGDRLTAVARLVHDQNNKLSRNQLAIAVAVCMAESGGNPQARCYNYKDPVTGAARCSSTPRADSTSVDRGMWQINSRWHPEVSDAVAFDPKGSTREAYRISGGFMSWSPWSAFKSGAYAKWLTPAGIALDDLGVQKDNTDINSGVSGVLVGGGNVVAGVGSGISSVGDFLGKLGDRHVWVRVTFVVAGLGALVVGALILSRDLAGNAASALVSGGKGAAVGAVASKAAAAAL